MFGQAAGHFISLLTMSFQTLSKITTWAMIAMSKNNDELVMPDLKKKKTAWLGCDFFVSFHVSFFQPISAIVQ